jgi:hypothetical protein
MAFGLTARHAKAQGKVWKAAGRSRHRQLVLDELVRANRLVM